MSVIQIFLYFVEFHILSKNFCWKNISFLTKCGLLIENLLDIIPIFFPLNQKEYVYLKQNVSFCARYERHDTIRISTADKRQNASDFKILCLEYAPLVLEEPSWGNRYG